MSGNDGVCWGCDEEPCVCGEAAVAGPTEATAEALIAATWNAHDMVLYGDDEDDLLACDGCDWVGPVNQFNVHLARAVVGVLTANGWATVKLPEATQMYRGRYWPFSWDGERESVSVGEDDLLHISGLGGMTAADAHVLALALLAAVAAVSPTQKEPE